VWGALMRSKQDFAKQGQMMPPSLQSCERLAMA
jgi:hypothetical protein